MALEFNRSEGISVFVVSRRILSQIVLSISHKNTKGTKENLRAFCASLWLMPLWRDAEDAPQSVVELEGRLRSVEVITRNLTRSARAVHWNYVHVI